MDTRLATRQVRLTQWAAIIKDRNESGLSIREYCERNEIKRDAYFYWLRKLRESAIASSGSQFVELSPPAESVSVSDPQTGVIVDINGARIHVENAACRDTLSKVLEVLGNAQ